MTLNNLHKIFKADKESGWMMKPYNAQVLYKFITAHPIKKVLDLGTGVGFSAAICALALKNKGEKDFHIDTVECFDKCIKKANELIPEELKEYITIHKSDAKVWSTDKIAYQYFSIFDVPKGEYDLIINDGPGGFMEGEHYLDLPNGTVTKMLLENKLKAGTYIAWDGRITMLMVLERYFADNFQLVLPSQKDHDMNIIERLDNEIHFSDFRLSEMYRQKYLEKNEKDMSTDDGYTALSEAGVID